MLEKILKTLKFAFALCGFPNFSLMFWTLSGVISGKNASVRTGSATYGSAVEFRIKNMNFAEAGSAIPCADSGDANNGMPHVPGKYITGSGSFDHICRYGETKLTVLTEYAAHIVDDDTSGDEVYYSGSIIITNKNHSADVEGDNVVMDNYGFTVNGLLTPTDNSAV